MDRPTVVRTALKLLDETGLDGLTLRRIATELDVKAPALYWHFASKQALLDEMATTVLADAVAELAPTGPVTWPGWLATYGRGLRRMLLRYRDGARMFSGTHLNDDTLYASMEGVLRALTEAGAPLRDAVWGPMAVYSYVIGFVIEEQATAGDERYDPQVRNQRLDEDALPLARAAGGLLFTGYEERFEYGLAAIVRGLKTAP
ncbi:TetR/AcrR family transcriptional regulator C-terminal domain-containing protein [Longispora albida]|uniref:TetR/AcrR family transcriptional regulator C-terminal domain-containing protein n=1 Tax=Longispora albida TaxID=203523 RepID=UPI00058E9950|nr:TetR/AcrR family transcriptional regulator C-terminal domain-containing protein [Longispora albida]